MHLDRFAAVETVVEMRLDHCTLLRRRMAVQIVLQGKRIAMHGEIEWTRRGVQCVYIVSYTAVSGI